MNANRQRDYSPKAQINIIYRISAILQKNLTWYLVRHRKLILKRFCNFAVAARHTKTMTWHYMKKNHLVCCLTGKSNIFL